MVTRRDGRFLTPITGDATVDHVTRRTNQAIRAVSESANATSLYGRALPSGAPATGQYLGWNGAAFVWATPAGGGSFAAAGDLSGSSTSQTVVGIRGLGVPSPTTSGTALTYVGGSLVWQTPSGGGSGFAFKATTVTSTYTIGTSEVGTPVDSSGGSFTVTLPASPTNNETHLLSDVSGACGLNPVTLSGGVANINGGASVVMAAAWGTLWVVYVSAAGMWKTV